MEDEPVTCMRHSPAAVRWTVWAACRAISPRRGDLGRTLPAGRVLGRPACPLRARWRGPALAHGRANLLAAIVIHCNPPSRRKGHAAETSWADSQAKVSRPPTAHLGIPVATAPITALAYDSAPYRSRPEGDSASGTEGPDDFCLWSIWSVLQGCAGYPRFWLRSRRSGRGCRSGRRR